jgi:hypothetical protein
MWLNRLAAGRMLTRQELNASLRQNQNMIANR